eukprot:g124.t1
MKSKSVDYDSYSLETLEAFASQYNFSSILSGKTSFPGLASVKKLHGGFSGSNYLITLKTSPPKKAVLKICNGYDEYTVESQAQMLHYLVTKGQLEKDVCTPFPTLVSLAVATTTKNKHSEQPTFVTLFEGEKIANEESVLSPFDAFNTGVPAMILSFVEGINGSSHPEPILFSIGQGMARLHRSSPPSFAPFVKKKTNNQKTNSNGSGTSAYIKHLDDLNFRTVVEKTMALQGGCCDILKHLDNTFWDQMHNSRHVKDHPFLKWYASKQADLKSLWQSTIRSFSKQQEEHYTVMNTDEVRATKVTKETTGEVKEKATPEENDEGEVEEYSPHVPLGFIHGDPFLDNCMVSKTKGEFASWIDFEDLTLGPMVYDVACLVTSCIEEKSSDDSSSTNEGGGQLELEEEEEKEKKGSRPTDVIPDLEYNFSKILDVLKGYNSVRPLTKIEIQTLIKWCKASLLCNCTWRFINFNIDRRDAPVSCRDAYQELQVRITFLEKHGDELVNFISKNFGPTAQLSWRHQVEEQPNNRGSSSLFDDSASTWYKQFLNSTLQSPVAGSLPPWVWLSAAFVPLCGFIVASIGKQRGLF